MPTQQALLAFALVSAGIMVIPGPSNFFLLAHGIGHGRRSALAAMTGIETASAIRVLLAVNTVRNSSRDADTCRRVNPPAPRYTADRAAVPVLAALPGQAAAGAEAGLAGSAGR